MGWRLYAPAVLAVVLAVCFILAVSWFKLPMSRMVYDISPQALSNTPSYPLVIALILVWRKYIPEMRSGFDTIGLAFAFGVTIFTGKLIGQIYLFANGKFDQTRATTFSVPVLKATRCGGNAYRSLPVACVLVEDWTSHDRARTLRITEQQLEMLQGRILCFSGSTGQGYFNLTWVSGGKFDQCKKI
jgi:hypothetical protein